MTYPGSDNRIKIVVVVIGSYQNEFLLIRKVSLIVTYFLINLESFNLLGEWPPSSPGGGKSNDE